MRTTNIMDLGLKEGEVYEVTVIQSWAESMQIELQGSSYVVRVPTDFKKLKMIDGTTQEVCYQLIETPKSTYGRLRLLDQSMKEEDPEVRIRGGHTIEELANMSGLERVACANKDVYFVDNPIEV